MSKSCMNCATQNADDTKFCAHCGTAFAAAPPPPDGDRLPGIVCSECHHTNRASARFCAKCGTDLSEQTVIALVRREVSPAPPLTPPVAPAVASSFGDETVPPPTTVLPTSAPASPDVPDVPAAAAPTNESFGKAPPSRGPLWIAFGLCVLVLIAAAAWRFAGPQAQVPPASRDAAGPQPAPAPVPPAASIAAAPPAVSTTAEAPASSASTTDTASPMTMPATEPAAANTAASAGADPAAQRARAAKARAAREARAKAVQEQQAAQAAVDQEAARKRADDTRAAAAQTAATKPVPATPAGPRTARDVCAGRNLISQAVCESRECGKPEHANEALCRQIKAAEERRSGGPQ